MNQPAAAEAAALASTGPDVVAPATAIPAGDLLGCDDDADGDRPGDSGGVPLTRPPLERLARP